MSTKVKKPEKKRPSTALAVRKKAPIVRPVSQPKATPADLVAATTSNVLGEDAALGALGLVEVKLTPKEEAVLNRPVDGKQVLIKPTGQPYVSHPTYTRLFNEAFGRLGWAIVPRGKAVYNGQTVVMPHILYIHGQPVAFAYGEQNYSEKNREQTYGDAIEACTASALRRCAKRLGVTLELWDKDWLNQWIADNAVRVTVNDRGESKSRWRRKTEPPLRGEIIVPKGKSSKTTQQPPPEFHGSENAIDADFRGEEDRPRDATHGAENEPITTQQAERLYKTAAKVQRTPTEIKMWLRVVYGYGSSKEIKRKEYNTILRTIEAPGPLPMREPGSDDA